MGSFTSNHLFDPEQKTGFSANSDGKGVYQESFKLYPIDPADIRLEKPALGINALTHEKETGYIVFHHFDGMAEFNCYVCSGKVITGEKFTFTKKGSVHFDCFIGSRRKELPAEKHEQLRDLSLLLDSQLKYLLDVLAIKSGTGSDNEVISTAYKNSEKEAGETTRRIAEL